MKTFYYYAWFSPLGCSFEAPQLYSDSREQKPGSARSNLKASCDKAIETVAKNVAKGARGTIHCVCSEAPIASGESLDSLERRASVRRVSYNVGNGYDRIHSYTKHKTGE